MLQLIKHLTVSENLHYSRWRLHMGFCLEGSKQQGRAVLQVHPLFNSTPSLGLGGRAHPRLAVGATQGSLVILGIHMA